MKRRSEHLGTIRHKTDGSVEVTGPIDFELQGETPLNFFPNAQPKRVGYRSFVGLIWSLWKANRSPYKTRYTFELPLKWF